MGIAEIPADKHRSYLKMIIRNICIDYYRSIHPTDTVYEIPLDLSDNSSGPEDIIIDRITVEAIVQAISELPDMKVLIFTGEVLNEKLWVDALNAGADGIILKTSENKSGRLQGL